MHEPPSFTDRALVAFVQAYDEVSYTRHGAQAAGGLTNDFEQSSSQLLSDELRRHLQDDETNKHSHGPAMRQGFNQAEITLWHATCIAENAARSAEGSSEPLIRPLRPDSGQVYPLKGLPLEDIPL